MSRTPPRIQRYERWDGHAFLNGRPHGSLWRPVWEVVVTFETEREAYDFVTAHTLEPLKVPA